ncbi:hypothetical protein NQ317_005685 [Molorchus minor]|uniref:Ribosome biogenesis protein BMS1/TSR1 C-terminal domain-containing protein n=1 Tax=Molorchus minor TaxID=1323400 RepID=A0ABQ9JRG6_9CUCU|nr:hypothetical protein NQ317_005685 [Molorchus minor]
MYVVPKTEVQNKFDNFQQIDMRYLRKLISSLPNKTGSDGIPTNIIKTSFEVIGNRFLDVINSSLQTGNFPNTWKSSLVSPVPKVVNSILAEQHRPINSLPIPEKILEITVKEQLVNYCNTNNIIIPVQSGFREAHSCASALQCILEEWVREIDDNKIVLAVFLDFKRAFETVDRKLLLLKLEGLGIGGTSGSKSLLAKGFKEYNNLPNEIKYTDGSIKSFTRQCTKFYNVITNLNLSFGDLKIREVSYLPDPCPLPEQIKRRALIEKEKLIYSPFSGVGGIVYDKDAVYIELGTNHNQNRREDSEVSNMVTNLLDTKEGLDVKMQQSELQLFTGAVKITAKDLENIDDNKGSIQLYEKTVKNKEESELEVELNQLRKLQEEKIHDSGRIRRKVVFGNDIEDFENNSNDSEDNEDENEISIQNGESSSYLSELLDSQNSDSDSENEINIDENNSDDEESISDSGSESFLNEYQDDDNDEIRWKENLAKKAQEEFFARRHSNKNVMRLVYEREKTYRGIFQCKRFPATTDIDNNDKSNDDTEEIGGLFKKVSINQQRKNVNKDSMNIFESSLMLPWNTPTKDWSEAENKDLIMNCFVTGKWKESEDAAELLKLDDAEDLSDANSEAFGDFEDLETGEKHTAKTKSTELQGTKRKRSNSEKDELADKELLAEKKRSLKEKFDTEYDGNDKANYYDDLKMSAEKQAQLNKTVFENMPDDLRVQLEGFRPGMYIRMEFENVPAEFVTNFDPTYPFVIGSLNYGEENIGYVNVKLKKHRWYRWRRFQTIPLYSKLEDDMKYRYLKYTPEHLACNAHFFGPITPQGTGFIALQAVEANQEVIKKIGFRIAATGSVQEVDKSTQILKKLKLVGYPMKIYKKTAFIKGMFNSALEVAKFEGTRVKTVSGIRGQIKKAVSKPEGCFRATFEDKILLSGMYENIVFCRTWSRVDVPEFYNPVVTLLLPLDKKNTWRGVRTAGEIKRENGLRNPAEINSLYTDFEEQLLEAPIQRNPKPAKPLIIPQKLQRALPYRDKPKQGVKFSDKKTPISRVAVIREPYEQKVSTMMKMIKTAYSKKQEKLKQETKERLEKHRQEVASYEANKEKKLKQKKKIHFKNKQMKQ